MMSFRTEYRFRETYPSIAYAKGIYATGSCFSEHILQRLQRAGFTAYGNSHGIVYNPLSLATGLDELISRKVYTAADLYHHADRWLSFAHHGSFSAPDAQLCLEKINHAITVHREAVRHASHIFITFGTGWGYYRKDNRQIVANCHKLPGDFFEKTLLDPGLIKAYWLPVLERLQKFNPAAHIIFTVSPVKHLRDGLHENQLGKAVLLLAIYEICKAFAGAYYFPAYELVTDDLRDYRFYDKDMAHPGSQAIGYIWERMSEVFFTAETRNILTEVEALRRLQEHIPVAESAAQHQRRIDEMRIALMNKYPYLSLSTKDI